MVIDRRVRLGVLAAHLVSSIGWMGAAACYLVLAVTAGSSDQPSMIRTAWAGMDLLGWVVIVPMAVAALTTGLVVSLTTAWGLLRHWWVVMSLVLTTFATTITVLHMPAVSETARRAAVAPPEELPHLGGDVFHPGVGLVVLLIVTALNVYKPRGRTTSAGHPAATARASS